MEERFPFSRKMSQYICHLCFQELLFLGNSHSPLVQWKGRVKLLLSSQFKLPGAQLKLPARFQVLVVIWVEVPLLGVLDLGLFGVPSHADVPINLCLFTKALPM